MLISLANPQQKFVYLRSEALAVLGCIARAAGVDKMKTLIPGLIHVGLDDLEKHSKKRSVFVRRCEVVDGTMCLFEQVAICQGGEFGNFVDDVAKQAFAFLSDVIKQAQGDMKEEGTTPTTTTRWIS